MNKNLKVKEQFNKQSAQFSNWPVTQDEKILCSLFNFWDIRANDRLLDVACGTGAFALYAAQRIKTVRGVDISEGMIGIALENAVQCNLKNIDFLCSDVEKLPFNNDHFDCVISKSAFHHMKNYQTVFKEMKRCCKPQGRIGIEDIASYDDKKTNDFFEELESQIDSSHHLTRSKEEIIDLYKQNKVRIFRFFESIPQLDFFDYLHHAVQSPEARQKINRLLKVGLKEDHISKWFVTENNTLFWKRKVVTMLGQKS